MGEEPTTKKEMKKKTIQREATSAMLPHVEINYTRGSSSDAASRVIFFFFKFFAKILFDCIKVHE